MLTWQPKMCAQCKGHPANVVEEDALDTPTICGDCCTVCGGCCGFFWWGDLSDERQHELVSALWAMKTDAEPMKTGDYRG
jgi:hypothetical protein